MGRIWNTKVGRSHQSQPPDELFGTESHVDNEPFWSKLFQDNQLSLIPDCTPVESRDAIVDKIRENFPEANPSELIKLI